MLTLEFMGWVLSCFFKGLLSFIICIYFYFQNFTFFRVNFKMDPPQAAAIVSLRPALESLVVRAATDPDAVMQFTEIDKDVIDIISELCSMNAGRFNLARYDM